MRLSDATIRSLPRPEKGQKTYWDDTLKGFGCRVSQGGSRSFVLQLGADRQLITIGKYHPDILSLATARGEAKRLLAERVLGKHRASSVTFDQAKGVFLEACARKNRARTVYDYTRILQRHFAFGRKQLSDISPADIQRKLDRIHAPAELRYATVLAKTFFKWAYKRAYVDQSPAERLDTRQSATRSRVLSDAELQSIWRACERRIAFDDEACGGFQTSIPDAVKMPRQYATIVKLLILTGQRRGEIAALRAEFLDPDFSASSSNQCTITLPATLTKNKREHVFPLGCLATSLLSSGSHSPSLFFSARGKPDAPFNGWSKSKAALDELSGVSDWTLHDARRSYATNMARLGVPIHIVERLLNHASGSFGGIVSVYQRHEYLDEMREAVNKYEAWFVEHVLQSKM